MESPVNYIKEWEGLFLKHRTYLVSFAFRMTGSLSEAEDLAQDTFLECAKIDPSPIENPKSWLTKVCSNKGLDHLKSAYKKRESYKGPWLPDAVPDSLRIWSSLNDPAEPDQNLLLSESLTTSFLLLIEKLTPEERVVYLLSEIFEYSFEEISGFLNKSKEACRKIAQRARESVASNRTKFVSDPDSQKMILRFFESAKSGDLPALLALLAEDSEFWSDGGGKVPAAVNVLRDPLKIAAFFKGLGTSRLYNSHEFKLEPASVNSRPGLIISRREDSGVWVFDTILCFEFKDGRIVRIYAQRNPDKLQALLAEN